MIGTRTNKNIRSYKKHIKNLSPSTCQFCEADKNNHSFVSETKSFKILRNIFPYSTWDLQNVTDHLMIVPKKHTDTLNDLNANEAVEYVDLLGSYECRGYNVYSRSPGSGMKSVKHQHTHLIKTSGQIKHILLYTRSAFLRISA